ncbi:MAG TPA: tetratricopeptide repeat protein [Candidatus Acidoferrum sp.]|nr:tetratricopeptide repeat protein [Candidatus Acidoferrum sp.]
MKDVFLHRRDVLPPPSSSLHPRRFFLTTLTCALLVAGCSPSGPRALLKGKKLIERGDYPAAVAQLKMATTLLATNAQAWNYLGVACQYAGQTTEATAAYQRALVLDRDLMEAHYNLGCLWLEQSKPDAAASEFVAYTLRRSKAPEGWLKLGLAQLQSHDLTAAEKSFSTALYLSPDNPEALNGLGLARVERGRPHDAVQFFTAATKQKPDYAPAWLNLATVAQQYLHDDALALQNYRAYLALKPRPANWDAVNDLANSLETPGKNAAASDNQPSLPPPENRPSPATGLVHNASLSRTQTVARAAVNPPRQSAVTPQVVKVQPEPVIVGTPVPGTPTEPTTGRTSTFSRLNPLNWFRSSAPETNEVAVVTPPAPAPAPTTSHNNRVAVTPLPPANPAPAVPAVAPLKPAPAAPAKPVKIVQPAVPTFPRYLYRSPQKPKPGDRRSAASAFVRAREAEQNSRWPDAFQAYREATEQDPAWFEAQYNYGVIAYRLRYYSSALAAYEVALAIQPDSVDARYNFALALKAAGYVTDAVNELEKILATNPNEVRAHLALGNLYARQMYNSAQARQHYLKVLQLDPSNSQAPDIHFWLSSNPG